DFDGMGSMDPVCIVVELIRIPGVEVVGSRVYAAKLVGKVVTADRQPRSSLVQCAAQGQVGARRIDCLGAKLVDYVVSVVTNACGIHKTSAERVGFFNRDGLSPGVRVCD